MSTMIPTYNKDESWRVAYSWFNKMGFKVDKSHCKENICKHSEYPAITSLVDYARLCGVDLLVVECNYSFLEDKRFPILLHTKHKSNFKYTIVNSYKELINDNVYSETWNGIAAYVEKDANWEKTVNNANYENKKAIISFYSIIIISLLLFSVAETNLNSLSAILLGATTFIGLLLSIIVLLISMNVDTPIINAVCQTSGEKSIWSGDCVNTIKRNTQNTSIFTPAELSLIYFATQYIIIILSIVNVQLIPIIWVTAPIGLIVIIWSLFTQIYILKSICYLCISICIVLASQFVLTMPFNLSQTKIVDTLYFSLALTIVIFSYWLISHAISETRKIYNLEKRLLIWDSDISLFQNILSNQASIHYNPNNYDIILGSREPKIKILVVISPFCNPCKEALEKLKKIYKIFSPVVQIICIFSVSDEEKKQIVGKLLFTSTLLNNDNELFNHITNIFAHSERQKLKTSQILNSENQINDIHILDKIKEYNNFINKYKINATPSIFFNNKPIPNRYSLDNIIYMLPEIIKSSSYN